MIRSLQAERAISARHRAVMYPAYIGYNDWLATHSHEVVLEGLDPAARNEKLRLEYGSRVV